MKNHDHDANDRLLDFLEKCDRISERMNFYILDDDGDILKVPMLAWAEWFSTDKKQLAYDHGDNWDVSSIFLGFDHSVFGDGKHLFETRTSYGDEYEIDRFTSREELMKHHRIQVALCEAGL